MQLLTEREISLVAGGSLGPISQTPIASPTGPLHLPPNTPPYNGGPVHVPPFM